MTERQRKIKYMPIPKCNNNNHKLGNATVLPEMHNLTCSINSQKGMLASSTLGSRKFSQEISSSSFNLHFYASNQNRYGSKKNASIQNMKPYGTLLFKAWSSTKSGPNLSLVAAILAVLYIHTVDQQRQHAR